MSAEKQYNRHYEEKRMIKASAENIFAYADDYSNFSSHMNKSSWMMGGGRMNTQVDSERFQKIGSHLKMTGSVFGAKLFLDEVVKTHNPPSRKEWETVGNINLIVIDHYRLGFEIKPNDSNSSIDIYIDYNLPKSFKTRLVGILFGGMYAKWCVRQMIGNIDTHFNRS